jgi:hypothetical protein
MLETDREARLCHLAGRNTRNVAIAADHAHRRARHELHTGELTPLLIRHGPVKRYPFGQEKHVS